MKVGGARLDKNIGDGLRSGVLETLEERVELCRRTALISDVDRQLLVGWYVQQLHLDDISALVGLSRRQCQRRRASAIKKIIDLGVAAAEVA
jgi:DNA-directed RNA polymerase specialized sigma subunit